jgi:hypothetical protein
MQNPLYSLFCALLSVGILLGPPQNAQAQEADSPPPGLKELKAAVQLQKEGLHEEAIQLFDAAFKEQQHPKVLFLKARSLVALERCPAALEIYKLIEHTDAVDATMMKEIAVSRRACVRVDVSFASNQGLELMVRIAGQPARVTPFVAHLKPGSYPVHASSEGYQPLEITVEVPKSGQLQVPLTLVKKVVPVQVPEPKAPVQKKPPPEMRTGTLAWAMFGTGLASALAGVGLFGHYGYVANMSHDDDQELENGTTQLVVAGALTAAGAGLMIGSFVLPKQPVSAVILPGPDGIHGALCWRF